MIPVTYSWPGSCWGSGPSVLVVGSFVPLPIYYFFLKPGEHGLHVSYKLLKGHIPIIILVKFVSQDLRFFDVHCFFAVASVVVLKGFEVELPYSFFYLGLIQVSVVSPFTNIWISWCNLRASLF